MTDQRLRTGPDVDGSDGPQPDQNQKRVALVDGITAQFAEGGSRLMRDFDLSIVDAEPGFVRFTLPVAPRLCHAGGVLSGQAILGCMDTGMVFVMMSLKPSAEGNFTTVQLNCTFERGVPEDCGEVAFEARATKTGRSLVFGQIDLVLPDGRRAASATTTYMWL